MEDTVYSGSYGLVVVPDNSTIDKAYELAETLYGLGAQYILSPGYLPHLTLYHSRFLNIPGSWLKKTLEHLNKSLGGSKFVLDSLSCFGHKFIFWNVDSSCSDYHLLLSAHHRALELVQYLDQQAPRRSDEEGISLSATEKENSRIYNHPLVRQEYSPHITLGYDSSSPEVIDAASECSWNMTVDRVAFVEIGHPGIVLSEVC